MWEKCSDELSNFVNHAEHRGEEKGGKGWSLSQHMRLSGYGRDSQDMVEKEGLLISVSFCFSYMFWLKFPKLCRDVGPLSVLKFRNLITKSPRQMWKLQPKYIICNPACFTAFSNKWMKTQNQTSCAISFAHRAEQGSCFSSHCCGLTCVFQFRCWHMCWDQKGKYSCQTAHLFDSDLTMACFLSKYTLWKCYCACYEANELHFLSSIGLAGTAGQHNQQVQSTTDRSKTNGFFVFCFFFFNSPLLVTLRKIQHLKY